jgi:hypothetical protein
MTRSVWSTGAAALCLAALVACGFGRDDVLVSSGSPGGIATSSPDSGFGDCEQGATLCVGVQDAGGASLSMAAIEVFDPDGELVVDELVESEPWCNGDLSDGEHVVVVELVDGGSVSQGVELICGDQVQLDITAE